MRFNGHVGMFNHEIARFVEQISTIRGSPTNEKLLRGGNYNYVKLIVHFSIGVPCSRAIPDVARSIVYPGANWFRKRTGI